MNNIPYIHASSCHMSNVNRVMKTIYHQLDMTKPLWISLDVDAIDGDVFKSTGTNEPYGLSIEFLHRVLKTFLPYAVGMDISEVNFKKKEASM